MSSVFVDTSWLKALLDEKDEFHKKALKVLSKIKEASYSLITTNYILDESFTLVRVRCGVERALQLRDKLAEMVEVLKIVRITSSDDVDAWEWFVKDWTGLSFTDCTSFVVMERLGIENVASFDKHFSRAGFKIISP